MSGWADAAGLLRSLECRARHVNDECSELAVPLPRVRKGTRYANVLLKTWIAEEQKKKIQHGMSLLIIFLCLK